MTKFSKMYYYTSKGEKKLNCYYVHIPKELVDKINLSEKELTIKIEKNKITIEEKK